MAFISIKNISKNFSGTQVLNNINLDLNLGKIHGLVGQNGAGKSTLAKIIGGTYRNQFEGELLIDNQKITKWDSNIALEQGIAMIHQELALVNQLSVIDNIFLGIENSAFNFFVQSSLSRYQELEDKIQFNLNPNSKVAELRIADQQKVEIMRALVRNAKVIIMDEPTSSLTNDEVLKLHKLMLDLKKENYLIIYVSHFLDNILEVCDDVTVLRDGNHIKTSSSKSETKNSLVEGMLGKSLDITFPKKNNSHYDEVILELNNVSAENGIRDISLKAKKGEVVGLLGLVGSGRTEILRTIFGIDKITAGSIEFEGKNINQLNQVETIKNGIAMIPEDRRKLGLVLKQNAKENITIANLESLSNGIVLNSNKEKDLVAELIKALDVTPNYIEGNINFYSGGNQQKVLFAKWMFVNPKLILLDEPTRGVDVGAKSKIYEIIRQFSEQGITVIIVSSELEEVMGLSDRAYLVQDGTIKDEIIPNSTTLDNVIYSLFDIGKKAS